MKVDHDIDIVCTLHFAVIMKDSKLNSPFLFRFEDG